MPDETRETPTVTIDPHPQCSYIDAVHGARCVRRDDSHLEHWIPVMQGDAEPAPPLTLPTGKVVTKATLVRAIQALGPRNQLFDRSDDGYAHMLYEALKGER